MDDQLREVRNGNNIEFILPPRDTGKLRIIGLILMLVSLIPLFIGWQFIVDPFQQFLEEENSSRYFSLAFAIAGLVPALLGLAIFLVGLCGLTMRSYVRIILDANELRAREQLGPFFKNWRMPRDKLKTLQVVNAATLRDNNKQVMTSVFYGIIAKDSGGTEIRMAPAYDLALLDRLTVLISAETGATVLEKQINHTGSLDVDKGAVKDIGPMPEQPAASTIEFEDRSEGLAVRVPPMGLLKGSKGLFIFSIVWSVMTIGFMSFLLYLAVAKGEEEAWGGALFMLIFLAIGIGTGLAAVNMGRRHADILLMHGMLTVKRISIFGEKVQECSLQDIKKIIHGPSGMRVNNKTVYELQVFNNDNEKTVGMLSQLDDNELRWLAELLSWKLKQLK